MFVGERVVVGGVVFIMLPLSTPSWDLPSISLTSISLSLSSITFFFSVLLSQRDLLVSSPFTQLGVLERKGREGGDSGERRMEVKTAPEGVRRGDLCVDISPHVFGHRSN